MRISISRSFLSPRSPAR